MSKTVEKEKLISLAEYARSRGLAPNAVQERLSSGAITENSIKKINGKILIDPIAADLDFEFLGDTEKSESLADLKEERDEDGEAYADDETGMSSLEIARKNAAAFKQAKIDTEKIRARKLELEIQLKEEKLLDVEQVRKRFIKIIGEVRDGILNVPGRVAPLVIGMTTTLEIEKKLYEELSTALVSLSRLNSDDEK